MMLHFLFAGLRQRGMNCVRNQDNVPVSMEHCSPAPRIPLTATCDVPCPVDCEVEEFGEWTPCSQTCGVEAMKTRHRAVLVAAKDGGRLCPHSSQLQQVRTQKTNHADPLCAECWTDVVDGGPAFCALLVTIIVGLTALTFLRDRKRNVGLCSKNMKYEDIEAFLQRLY